MKTFLVERVDLLGCPVYPRLQKVVHAENPYDAETLVRKEWRLRAGEQVMATELEDLKQENERLRTTIRQLRHQLALYQTQDRKRYQYDRDYLPYEEDRDRS